MRIVIISFALILIFTLSVLAGPAVEISPDSFNFGKTIQRTKISHTFWIKSTGDQDLIITKIEPGCGCTQAPIGDTVVAPGDSTALEIILSTKSYRGFLSKRPYILTNASDEKKEVRIDAELIPNPADIGPVLCDPPQIDVSQFTEKPRRKAKFKLLNKSDKELKLNLIDKMGKKFTVELPETIPAHGMVEGTIVVNEDMIESEFDQSFTIMVDDDFATRISIPVQRTYRLLNEN